MKNLEVFGTWYDGILNSFPFCLDEKLYTWNEATLNWVEV